MPKLVYESERIERLPEALIKKGYKPPAFVEVYDVGEGKFPPPKSYYMIRTYIDFDFTGDPPGADRWLDKNIPALPLFKGSEAEAINKGKSILKDVENWPKY